MTQLKAARCITIYIDGSFVTAKQKPGDFDACWEDNGVDIDYLKAIAPTLSNFGLGVPNRKTSTEVKFFLPTTQLMIRGQPT